MNSHLFLFLRCLFISSQMLFQWTLEILVMILKKFHRGYYMICIHLINIFWKFNIFIIFSISNQKDIFMFALLTNLSNFFFFTFLQVFMHTCCLSLSQIILLFLLQVWIECIRFKLVGKACFKSQLYLESFLGKIFCFFS